MHTLITHSCSLFFSPPPLCFLHYVSLLSLSLSTYCLLPVILVDCLLTRSESSSASSTHTYATYLTHLHCYNLPPLYTQWKDPSPIIQC